MTRLLVIGVIACIAGIGSTTFAYGSEQGPMTELEKVFVQKAAQGHYAEVALGQLAVQKASDDRVKQFGARMIQDHQKAAEEAHKLTSQEGTPLPSQLSMPHQQIQQKLSQLSGKDFDRAYMAFMVGEHMKDVGEFEQRAKTLTDPRAEQWTSSTLRLLKNHIEQAKAIASTIGVTDNEVSKKNEHTSP